MKKVVFFFLLISFIYSFDYFAKAKLIDGFYSLGVGRVFYITEDDTFLCDFFIGNYNSFSLAFDTAYKKRIGDYSFIVGAEDLLARNTNPLLFSGTIFQLGLADLEVGMLYKSEKLMPYCSFSYNLGPFLPYIKVTDHLTLGLNYGFDLELSNKEQYFKMVYPIKDLDTNKKTIIVKGYFLDTGKIYLNGEEMPVRADGMFIKPVNLNNGNNDYIITMDGKTLGNKSYNFKVNKKYQYYDLDIVLQNKWENIINLSGYPKGEEFLSEQSVKRGDFYVALGRTIALTKKGYDFNEYFTDVSDQELKKYLYSFYGKGYMPIANIQFVPEKPILRQEAFTVLSRILPDSKKVQNNYNFVDVSTKDIFYPYVNKLMNNNVLNSLTVNPYGYLTRADFYKYIYAMKNNLELLKDNKIENKQEVGSSQVIEIVMPIDDYTRGEISDK